MKSKKLSGYDDKRDYISQIQKNLQSMKIAAQQYLSKGNLTLPPIITTRHYLFHDLIRDGNKANKSNNHNTTRLSQSLMNSVPSVCNIEFDSIPHGNPRTNYHTNQYLNKIINTHNYSNFKTNNKTMNTKTDFKIGNPPIINLQYSGTYSKEEEKIIRRKVNRKLTIKNMSENLSLTEFETIQSQILQDQTKQQQKIQKQYKQSRQQRLQRLEREFQNEFNQNNKNDQNSQKEINRTQEQIKQLSKQHKQQQQIKFNKLSEQNVVKQPSIVKQWVYQYKLHDLDKQTVNQSLQMRQNIAKRHLVNTVLKNKIAQDKLKSRYQRNHPIRQFSPWESQEEIVQLDF